jgi:phage repressor protein C with HTH and peptisase S24 domain
MTCLSQVIGFAIATPDQDGYFDDMGLEPGASSEFVPWPTRDKNAYALRVRGDSMQSRIRPGEIIVVEPNTEAMPGQDVVIRTKSGRKMVKRLLFKRGDEITLGSINDAYKPVTISVAEIESVHLVAAIVQGSMAKERLE